MLFRLSTLSVLLTVLIDGIGVGLIIPVMPDLIREIRGISLSDAAIWGSALWASYAIMQFLCGPLIGNLSDRFGRRPVMLISLAVMTLMYFIMAVAGSIWLLLIGRFISGTAAATQSTAAAYMADILPPDKRGQGFAIVTAAFGAGFVLGPVMGGLLADVGTRAPFWAACVLSAVTFLISVFALPETITDQNRRSFVWSRANPLGAFRDLGKLPNMGHLLGVMFLFQLAFFAFPTIWAYYTRAQFGWDSKMIGISLAIFGIAMAVVQGGAIRFILAWFGEGGTVKIGFAAALASFAGLCVLTNGTLVLIFTPVGAIAGIALPALQQIMSRTTPDDAQGALQGLFSSLNALAFILSPIPAMLSFAAATRPNGPIYFPGAPFLLSFLLCAAGLYLFLRNDTE